MKQTTSFFYLLFLLNYAVAQSTDTAFNKVYSLIEQKNFFKAKEVYAVKKKELSSTHQKVVDAFLDNAFNRLENSNKNITELIKIKNGLPDSIILELYKTKEDNSVKLFDYKEAKKTLEIILRKYKDLLSEDDLSGMENNLKIWTALEDQPKQRVQVKGTTREKMIKDKAGLNNLKVFTKKDSINFIFDTGANLSTISESTAGKFNMKVIPVDIEVGTITGSKVPARLAVSPLFKIGNIEIRNTVFLVFADSLLSFSQINYQIHGILGFPVIEALREIQITQDGYFIVPENETEFKLPSNMAMNGLTPLIYIDGKHFTFDTGADNTILYHLYFIEHRSEIEKNYQPAKIKFAGAGGQKVFDGFLINKDFHLSDTTIHLKNIQLLKEKVKSNETVYGNIGQDLIKKFSKMTLNFGKMFIEFE